MKTLLTISMLFVFSYNTTAQSINIDSISKEVFIQVDSFYKSKIQELTRIDEHIIDKISIDGARRDLYEMKLLTCSRFKTFRRFLKCMYNN
jgi:hypothetical protein